MSITLRENSKGTKPRVFISTAQRQLSQYGLFVVKNEIVNMKCS